MNSCGGFKKKKIKYWMLRKFGLENWCDENHAICKLEFIAPKNWTESKTVKFGLIDVSHGMCEFHKWQFQQKPKYWMFCRVVIE